METEERIKKLEEKLELIIQKMKLEDALLRTLVSQVKIHSEYLQDKDAEEYAGKA